MNISYNQKQINFYQNNNKQTLSGIFPIFSDNSKIYSAQNIINILDEKTDKNLHSPYLIINGSKLLSQNNSIIFQKNLESITTNYYCSICAINSFSKIYDNPSKKLKVIDTENSFTNIYTIAYNKDIDKQVGGFIYYNDDNNKIYKENNLIWSSQLSPQNGTQTNLYWQTLNQNSILIDLQKQNIKVKYNGQFYSNSNACQYILYDKKPFGGFFNYVKFDCQQYFEEKENPQVITLQNKKHNYYFYSLLKIKLSDIKLSNIFNVILQNIDLNKVSIQNSRLSLSLNSELSNITSYNSIIDSKYYFSKLTNYSTLSGTIFNIKSICKDFNTLKEDPQYQKGYSVIISTIKGNESNLFNNNIFSNLGNQLWTLTTIKPQKKNNCYKFGLESHSHKYYGSAASTLEKGTLFPTQSVISHTLYNNKNYKYIIDKSEKCSYYPIQYSINQQLIPQQNILPVGAVIGFYQYKNNNSWFPQVPFGFYELSTTTNISVLLNSDDPASPMYNEQLGKILGVDAKGMIKLPKGSQIIYNNDNCRIIKIIKYAESWQKVNYELDEL